MSSQQRHRTPPVRASMNGRGVLRALRARLRGEEGAVAIEYVIVAIALLAIAGAIAGALTTLGDDAVEQIPDSVSEVSG